MLAALVRHHLGEGHAGRPGDRGRGRGCRRGLRKRVQHVDDPAPFSGLHARPHQSAEADGGKQFEVEVFLPGLVGDVLERHRASGSRIVDENVDAAEIGRDPVMGLGNFGCRRDVADIVADRETVLGEFFPRCLQILLTARQDRDLGAGLGKPPRHCEPQALAAAGDDGNAIVHCYLHVVLSLYADRTMGGAQAIPIAFVGDGRAAQPCCRAFAV